MAKRRTKKQKIKAQKAAQAKKGVRPEKASKVVEVEKVVDVKSKTVGNFENLMDDRMVKQDLFKSLIVTCLLLILLFGMYWYLG